MNAALPLPMQEISLASRLHVGRVVPLVLIIALHLGFFYALQSGLLQPPPAQIVPKEVLVHFITPEPAPKVETVQPPAPPKPPKTVPIIKKPAPKPPQPAVKPAVPTPPPAPSEPAITVPQAPAPAAPEPSAAAPQSMAPVPAPAPAAPAAPPPPKTVTSGVEYLQPPQPEYPLLSRRKGEEGKVVLRALINLKGRPDQVEIQQSSGSARLDEAARQAVLRAVFKPHLEDGKPVMVYAIVPIKFQLDR